MKKSSYLIIGLVAGALVSTSASALAAQVQSLVGKKVAGEYVVKVDGKKLSDKAIVVDGKSHLPVRSITDALGAKIDVVEKGEIVISSSDGVAPSTERPTSEYAGWSKQNLENTLDSLKNNLLKTNEQERARVLEQIEQGKKDGVDDYVAEKEAQLKEYDARIEKYKTEIAEIEALLAETK